MIPAAQVDIQIIGEPIMDINSSRTWCERFQSLLAEYPEAIIHMDMSAVEKIDTAFLQLLAAFVLSARDSNVEIEWLAPSERFMQATRSLNLNSTLGIPT